MSENQRKSKRLLRKRVSAGDEGMWKELTEALTPKFSARPSELQSGLSLSSELFMQGLKSTTTPSANLAEVFKEDNDGVKPSRKKLKTERTSSTTFTADASSLSSGTDVTNTSFLSQFVNSEYNSLLSSSKQTIDKRSKTRPRNNRKLCKKENCEKHAQGNTSFCFKHGGGYRCGVESCKKPARGKKSFCILHGGGKRCKKEFCDKSAQGKTDFCKRHGGGKRCSEKDCDKSARGKSDFCSSHGGGQRCTYVEDGIRCQTAARSKYGLCLRHGGSDGKRCRVKSCDKLSLEDTDLCKTHSII